ncbi:MAG: hypothetical protein PVI91_17295 [Gammaproteobacteria bacterium]
MTLLLRGDLSMVDATTIQDALKVAIGLVDEVLDLLDGQPTHQRIELGAGANWKPPAGSSE